MKHPIIRIAQYTLVDEVRQKSVVILFIVCTALVLLLRGCYQGNFVVNGQALDADTMIRIVAKMTFHVVAAGVMLLAALLAMRALRRDREDGMQSCILSKPITRRQYVAGKILGLWVLSSAFMMTLHGAVFIMTSISTKVLMPGLLIASVLCTVNLLFIVTAVLLLSLLMPDLVAFFSVVGIGIGGMVADAIAAIRHSQMTSASGWPSDFSAGDVLYYLWPKLPGMQQLAASFIGPEAFRDVGSVYPFINILLYGLILVALLFWRIGKEDIL
jgi:ABC-type transport system involved in multi-copper enzyme maturation permease subunit